MVFYWLEIEIRELGWLNVDLGVFVWEGVEEVLFYSRGGIQKFLLRVEKGSLIILGIRGNGVGYRQIVQFVRRFKGKDGWYL